MNAPHDSGPGQDLGVFIGIVGEYFEKMGGVAAQLLPASLEWETPERLDTTGYMPVSGGIDGWISLNMPDVMLDGLLAHIGESRRDSDTKRDLAAEMAGSITSHARAHFGARLRVSPPFATRRADPEPALPKPTVSFKLPFRWQGEDGFLLVACHS